MTEILDRYYTPPDVAKSLISPLKGIFEPSNCIDTACGGGNLLAAASEIFPTITCIGIDKDRQAILKLRKQQPAWLLSVGDMLDVYSYKRTNAISMSNKTDLMFINPPFSQNRKKKIYTSYDGISLKASVAMAHVLTSLDVFRPNIKSLIILPESVLYSEVDEIARSILNKYYKLQVLNELTNDTFSGARVNSVVATLAPRRKRINSSPNKPLAKQTQSNKYFAIIRGGLPVHEVKNSKHGIPYIHSTDLKNQIDRQFLDEGLSVTPISRGLVSGWVILIPRVGVPAKSSIRANFSTKKSSTIRLRNRLTFQTAKRSGNICGASIVKLEIL